MSIPQLFMSRRPFIPIAHSLVSFIHGRSHLCIRLSALFGSLTFDMGVTAVSDPGGGVRRWY